MNHGIHQKDASDATSTQRSRVKKIEQIDELLANCASRDQQRYGQPGS